ncbi:enoyl-CoA hydratase, partial [Glaesserella parasuis]|nr:enoyl-CoA hydratase [Glaesserella parasuis]
FYFEITKGKKYDLWGALGVVLRNTHSNNRYFCSEWCGEVLGIKEAWRFSPNDLEAIARSVL